MDANDGVIKKAARQNLLTKAAFASKQIFLTAEDAEERGENLEVIDHTPDAVFHLHNIEI
jgi:hypothetical protein